MAVGFANAVHIALRLSAVAGAADLHATRQLLLPLHVVAGAAGDSHGAKVFSDRVMAVDISAFRFD